MWAKPTWTERGDEKLCKGSPFRDLSWSIDVTTTLLSQNVKSSPYISRKDTVDKCIINIYMLDRRTMTTDNSEDNMNCCGLYCMTESIMEVNGGSWWKALATKWAL